MSILISPPCHSERQVRRKADESEESHRAAMRRASAETLRFAQGDGVMCGVEYCDRTVSMSEAAPCAVEKVGAVT